MLSSIFRQVDKREKLNILCSAVHERVSSVLCQTGHNFYLFDWPYCKRWISAYNSLPDNFSFLPVGPDKYSRIPPWLNLDLVMIESVGHYQTLMDIARQLHIPTIRYEHCTTLNWSESKIRSLRQLSCDHNVFITDYSRRKWMFSEENSEVIDHAIDSERFSHDGRKKKNSIVVVANDYRGRSYILGYDIFERITKELPTTVVGDTPGLSKAANSPEHLIDIYRDHSIFLNTSRLSPQPLSMLEAASMGLACVSTATEQIPYYFTHGENALLSNDENELRSYLVFLLQNPTEARRLGDNARKLIQEKFSKEVYLQKWNDVFYKVANKGFTGIYP